MRPTACVLALFVAISPAQAGGLLRNGEFRDDWLTLLPRAVGTMKS